LDWKYTTYNSKKVEPLDEINPHMLTLCRSVGIITISWNSTWKPDT